MLNTNQFGKLLKSFGYNFYSGVPCSFLKPLINYAINDCEYIGAANEGDAVAICSGAHLGGKKTIVLMQNSGLTNAISPLTSLNYSFKIPILGFVSLRGEEGIGDEPQHELMGQITTKILETIKVEWLYLSDNIEQAKDQIKIAEECIKNNKPFFFVVKKNTFDDVNLNSSNDQKNEIIKKPTRLEILKTIDQLVENDILVLATTGKTGRELYEINDSPNYLYMVGSMGCISSMGLGLSLTNKKVIVIDGDGSILMRMGNLATIGNYNNGKLLHILLDNNCHDSTGGQKTVSNNVDFAKVASASGYSKTYLIESIDELKNVISEWKDNLLPTFLCVKIKSGSKKDLGRPKVKPFEVKERMIEFINQ